MSLSLVVDNKSFANPVSDQVQFEEMNQVNQFYNGSSIINSINNSLNDPTWDSSTSFINRKYTYQPKNYQVFRLVKVFEQYVGYIIIRKHKQKDTSYLSFVVVDSQFQKMGIGKKLLNSAVKEVQKMGAKTLILDCRDESSTFYEKFAEEHHFSYSKEQIGQYAFGATKTQITIDLSENISAKSA